MLLTPHNLDYEAAIIGGAMQDADAERIALTCMVSDDFVSPVHRALWDSMLSGLSDGNREIGPAVCRGGIAQVIGAIDFGMMKDAKTALDLAMAMWNDYYYSGSRKHAGAAAAMAVLCVNVARMSGERQKGLSARLGHFADLPDSR